MYVCGCNLSIIHEGTTLVLHGTKLTKVIFYYNILLGKKLSLSLELNCIHFLHRLLKIGDTEGERKESLGMGPILSQSQIWGTSSNECFSWSI